MTNSVNLFFCLFTITMVCDRNEEKGRPHSYACLMLKRSIFVLNLEKLDDKIAQELLIGVKRRPWQDCQSQ